MNAVLQAPDRHSLVEWVLERNQRRLICALTADADSYEVVTQPLWGAARGKTERFRDPLTAFHRHAAIAGGLREEGWVVAAFTPPGPPRPGGHLFGPS